jgi:hypothetical protein
VKANKLAQTASIAFWKLKCQLGLHTGLDIGLTMAEAGRLRKALVSDIFKAKLFRFVFITRVAASQHLQGPSPMSTNVGVSQG